MLLPFSRNFRRWKSICVVYLHEQEHGVHSQSSNRNFHGARSSSHTLSIAHEEADFSAFHEKLLALEILMLIFLQCFPPPDTSTIISRWDESHQRSVSRSPRWEFWTVTTYVRRHNFFFLSYAKTVVRRRSANVFLIRADGEERITHGADFIRLINRLMHHNYFSLIAFLLIKTVHDFNCFVRIDRDLHFSFYFPFRRMQHSTK